MEDLIHFCKMKGQGILLGLTIFLFTSCIVQSPKYTSLEQVLKLKVGMSKAMVEAELGIEPYDVKFLNDTRNVFVYVYRIKDRRTLSIYTKPTNGTEVMGRYVQLAIEFSNDDKLISIESCHVCPNLEKTTKIDYQKIFVFITATLPVVLIYFGLK